jgi:Protein of unknown function (DUF2934)
MARKHNEARSVLSAESAAAGMPVTRRRTSHTKAAQRVESTPATPKSEPPAPTSAHDEIALLAYSYWEARGQQGGSAEEDWLRAEREFEGLRIASAS